MQIGSSALRGRPWTLIAMVVVLGLSVGLVVESASGSPLSNTSFVKAQVAKKCKKSKKSAATAKKKKCKKHRAPAVTPPAATPPTPQALTEQEVVTRIDTVALGYCNADPDCVDWGHFTDIDTGQLSCESKSTYSWSCYGGNEEYWLDADPAGYWLCAFLEIVERDGINGIKSHTDTGYGWDCFPET
jgi:hypothetical protein